MQYIGSKNRLSKELTPIIQSYITEDTVGYLEPFVGGANMIDKIQHHNKIGCDIHKELIALLNKVKDGMDSIPDGISEEEYIKVKDNKECYEDWYVGLVGFCGSYGAKYFGGYAKGNDTRNRQNEAIRNLKKQSPYLKDIEFINCSFSDIPKDKIKNHVIYCDPPYRDTTNIKQNIFHMKSFISGAEI